MSVFLIDFGENFLIMWVATLLLILVIGSVVEVLASIERRFGKRTANTVAVIGFSTLCAVVATLGQP